MNRSQLAMVKCLIAGLWVEWGGRKNVLVTHPLNRSTGCKLARKVEIPAGRKTVLHLAVANDPRGDWLLLVNAGGKEIFKKLVGKESAPTGWLAVEVDLSPMAGKTVELELVNHPNNWLWEAAYWGEIRGCTS